MKNRNIVMIIAALCVMTMGACFSPWDGSGEEGNIVINVGNGGARALVPGAVYTIILTTSGETSISKTTTGGAVDFSVPPGPWNILVRADKDNKLNAYGKTDVEVKARAKTDATVTLTLTDVNEVVNAWTDLKKALEKASAKNQIVMITSKQLIMNDYIEIGKGTSITLLAEVPVTIIKDGIARYSLFRVPTDSSLILGEKGSMPIIIDGSNSNKTDNSSLIFVGKSRMKPPSSDGDGGTLIINDHVTLTNNHVKGSGNDNRGGGVTVDGGKFTMNGGEISRNSAKDGGGVLILEGAFKQDGGTIFGYTAGDSNSNRATNNGHAVAYTPKGGTSVYVNSTSTRGSWED